VFYFEPAPASDSPGPGSGGEAPPDDGPVLLPPVRRGRYVAAGVAGLAAAGAAAYFLTPLGQQVDALLAPEAPPLVIARGTSVGSAQLPPDVVPPPPREAAPPAAKAPGENQGTPATSPVPAPGQGEEKPRTIERNKHQADAAAAAPKTRPAPSGQRDVKPVTKQQKEEGRPAAKADEDVLAADEEPAAPQHAAGEAEVMGLVRRYVAAQDNSDIDGLVALYDDRVDFHEYKLAGPDYIRNYRREFFEKWPKVETVLVGQVEINWSDSTTANVVFTTSIHVREPPLENPGRTKNKLTVRVTHGALKIVSEHQEVQVAPS
jgi:hypothetical protein